MEADKDKYAISLAYQHAKDPEHQLAIRIAQLGKVKPGRFKLLIEELAIEDLKRYRSATIEERTSWGG